MFRLGAARRGCCTETLGSPQPRTHDQFGDTRGGGDLEMVPV